MLFQYVMILIKYLIFCRRPQRVIFQWRNIADISTSPLAVVTEFTGGGVQYGFSIVFHIEC